ncbi:amino acid ABC transporter substrate-binding protein [Ligilactobacillus salitolerans]|uniref:Amino acid ABC transporter substrate-binding protein n=1 Tax=Ligilactobacillus salitolerans TaxID=1808352 RepID=A0A401IPY1_9LACO|nr:transporter substrate-binding domain-containing protein [Ligilactobacillus salitolerans]GBG93563.1 amino acid ABC transporter substrate-binding protein [Ligilactobacillus salitolerans]
MRQKHLKRLTLGVLCTLTLLVLASCGNKNSEDSVKRIQNKNTLVLGTSADDAPFEFPIVQNGKKKIIGYDIMVGQKIADDLGVKLKVENIAFPSLLTELQDKKVDLVLAGMVKTPAREKAVSFSKPYHQAANVLLVRKEDAHKYNHVSDLNGKSIGAQQSSAQEKIAKTQLPKASLVTESSRGTLTAELKSQKVDGVLLGKDGAEIYTLKYPNQYAIAQVKLKTTADISAVSIGVNKDDKALLKRINKKITELKHSGELDKMFKQAQAQQAKYGK